MLLLVALFSLTEARAQEELTVYENATGTNGYVPVYGFYADAYNKCEFVIPADGLADMEGGTISQMTFYLSSPAQESWGSAEFQVFMKEVNDATISAFSGTADATIVYEGSLDGTQSEMTIEFTSEYQYQGGNLLVGIYQTETGTYKSATFTGAEVNGASISGYSYDSFDAISATQRNFVPKTTFTYTPSGSVVYYKPKDLTMGEITATTAAISWTAPAGDVTGYAYQYKKAAEGDEAWSTEQTVTSTSVSLSSLDSSTPYNFRVKAVYAGGESGYATINFTTDCDIANLPFNEGFEYGIPCWTLINESTANASDFGISSAAAQTGSNCFRFSSYNSSSSYNQYLISPEMNATKGVVVQFSYKTYSSSTETFKVGYSTTTNDPSAFTWGDEISANNSGSWALSDEYEFPAGTKYVAIWYYSNYQYRLYVDDFSFSVPTSVLKPTDLAAVPTAKSAELSWTENGEATAWQICLNGDETNLIAADSNPFMLNDLTPETTYTVKVRASVGTEFSRWSDAVSFTTLAQFPVPTSLAAVPATTSAELSWTENGEATAWQICLNGDETDLIAADSNPFTLDGLTPETTYTVKVRATDGTEFGRWSDEVSFTTLVQFPAPTDLAASHVTATSANISWTGSADSYNIRYATSTGRDFFDDFENGLDAKGWTTIRNADGTEYTDWRTFNPSNFQDPIPAHSGDNVAMSRSWASSAYSVDNWLISPRLPLGGTMTYWVMDDGQYHEHYDIYVSTTTTDISAFTKVYEPGDASDSWTQVSVDLSSFAGQEGYVAFRLTDEDQDFLFIDDVTISAPIAGDWTTVNGVTSPYALEGLTLETQYVVQVQAVYADGESNWTSPVTFTTTSPNDAPTELAATDVKATSATLDWAGSQESYTLQYRHELAADPTAPATIIFTADDVWGDGSGYQMLLDADATAYGTIIPESGALTSSGDASAEIYAEFEYKIPVNADGALTTVNIVADNSIIIQIPAGTYDWCITNPTAGDRMWIASGNGNVGGRYDDYVFEAAKTYEFHVYLKGTNDATDVTITRPMSEWTVVENVTAPYELTGLAPETYYEWQVQGNLADDTTEWSELSSFTTDVMPVVVELADDADNTALIEALNGQTANVQLTGRTLYKDGSWNTICLPFDVTVADSPLAGATVMELDAENSSLNQYTLTLNFTEREAIVAGKPYLIKWESGDNLTEDDLVFNGVEIKKDLVPAVVGSNVITFSGNFAPVTFTANDKSILYVGANNKLYYPNAEVTMNAFRAYFQVDGSSLIKHFALKFSGDDATGISSVEAGNGNETIYNVAGQRLNKAQKGVNIVNGKKILK